MTQSKPRVLIIEDEKSMMDALHLKLSSEGLDVSSAFDGREGLELVDREVFDCILLDLVMPKVDGFVVLGELQKKKNAPPIIVLTNLSQGEDEQRAKELGAKAFFVKTDISINDIVTEVKKVVEKK
ncbi:MAG: response regulator [Candidatus Uhrbacteria bacterium]|nr:response regulator [Candidatus Uhrbacteria bacterium]